MIKQKRVVLILSAMIAVAIGITGSNTSAKRKMVKEYLGKWYVSCYKPHDSTQNGHRTSSGRRAKSGRTVAVDLRNPKAKMGTWVHIQGFGKLRVEDYGGFGCFNGGRRAFDVFRENHEQGGLWLKKCWKYRIETKKEYKKRLRKEELQRERNRKRRQRGVFILKYDEHLKPFEIITDPNFIKGGSVSFGGNWFNVVKTKRGLKNTILINDILARDFEVEVKLNEVAENAVG